MKVLHVNNVDLFGRRFNGYDLLIELRSRGIEGRQAVLTKCSDDPDVIELLPGAADKTLQAALRAVERRHSYDKLLFPWVRELTTRPEFLEADVVHYHLIHNEMVSLLDLPEAFGLRPSVWTFHDPWALTGHCIYPRECGGWLSGCTICPHLDWTFEMTRDRAAEMWALKKRMYRELDVEIVVASEFMLEMVRRSPLTAHFENVHLIPFGVDAEGYLADENQAASRLDLAIPPDDFVLCFRSTTSEVKGLAHVVEALSARPPVRPTTLLTFDTKGLLGELEGHYNIVDLGWVLDDTVLRAAYSACDVFLMPSLAEAFGLMALEAMAAGRPVISFEGTSLPSITYAPECGLAVPAGDTRALRAAIDQLAGDPDETARRGSLAREIVKQSYRQDLYLDKLAALYRSVKGR